MSQLDVKRGQDEMTILRDVLHVIATNHDPSDSVPLVLQAVKRITEADGAAFFLFHEPRLFIGSDLEESVLPDDEIVKNYAAALPEGVFANVDLPDGLSLPYPAWAVAPISVRKKTVGVLLLVFSASGGLSKAVHGLLLSLVDGLTVISLHARSQARHERLNRNQNEFTRIVSHDLRSPLTAIKGFASMLETSTVGDLNEKQAHFVDKILSGISQMTMLVENIQDAGRYDPETGFYEMERSPCDLVEIAQKIVNNHLVPAEKQELSLFVTAGDDIPIINADLNMLERAIINLVDNAIKYTPNGGRVEVKVQRQADQVLVKVIDSGYGITPEHQKHLFGRHFRIARREHRKVKGSGLGLFIVRSVAQRHGGEAWVESVEGEGSTFCISIPLSGDNLLGSASKTSE